MYARTKIILFAVLALFSSFSFPDEKKYLSRKAANIPVFDGRGNRYELFTLLRNKPLIICPIYTKCPSLCGVVNNGVQKVINKLGTLGKDFNVISFSFDSTDKGKDLLNYESRYRMDGENWKTVSAEASNIMKLMGSLDFQYEWSDETKEYNHPPIIIILSPSGRISRYIYGVSPSKRDLRLGIITASAEKTTPGLLKGFYMRCFAFDPKTKTYHLDWGFIISTSAGLLIIGIMCSVFFKSFIARDK